jgi:hypothetical protein
MDVLYFAWLDSPCEIDPDVDFPQFEHIGTLLYDCSKNYTAGNRRKALICRIGRRSKFFSVRAFLQGARDDVFQRSRVLQFR